jgi:hypothetical protein
LEGLAGIFVYISKVLLRLLAFRQNYVIIFSEAFGLHIPREAHEEVYTSQVFYALYDKEMIWAMQIYEAGC